MNWFQQFKKTMITIEQARDIIEQMEKDITTSHM